MMEWLIVDMLKYTVSKNSAEVVVLYWKNLFLQPRGFWLPVLRRRTQLRLRIGGAPKALFLPWIFYGY